MRVFISWSGKRSLHIATAIRDWLPNVLQAVRPFISSQDIRKGTRGNVVISKRLKEANVGIICLTPENMTAPWILYEAGALSKLLSAYVCTYLWQLKPSDIEPPLGQFQHTRHSEDDVRALVEAINSQLPDDRALSRRRLEIAFAKWWPVLDEKIKATPDKPRDEAVPKKRSDKSKLDELLELVRSLSTETKPVRLANDPSHYETKHYVRNLQMGTMRLTERPKEMLALLNTVAMGNARKLGKYRLIKLTDLGLITLDDKNAYTLTKTGESVRSNLMDL